ncbi:hypothetical protein BWQ96_08700 [Gracilariopsis chorda]|uniref:Uncharacterized protein n=1 Tax=Gracilariopsis chorda TaxID=448386 RepID=A0A2V3IHL9_9FLOR|nr:hypothetical protein BWQ96_08700 [Gracilariopsis chorda]|eukprot:PXF41586.1 hypothetical protein BWQ96_08700 [Gracilariopsis chorda]
MLTNTPFITPWVPCLLRIAQISSLSLEGFREHRLNFRSRTASRILHTSCASAVSPSSDPFRSNCAPPKSDPLLPEELRPQREMPPRYDPHALEQVLYQWWESAGLENRDLFGIVSDIAVQALSDSREDFNFFDFKVTPFASGKLIREAYDTSDAFVGRKQTLAVS